MRKYTISIITNNDFYIERKNQTSRNAMKYAHEYAADFVTVRYNDKIISRVAYTPEDGGRWYYCTL